jgi:protein-disulfide isomerase
MANRLSVPLGPDDHILGSSDANVELVEYGDFECPNCGRAYPIVNQVQLHFGDDLLFVFRHFPLIEVHPHAEMAAETAEWAGTHDRFWEMHDLIFQNQEELSLPMLLAAAEVLKLDQQELAVALENATFEARVRRDIQSGLATGVQGTPTFFINGEQHVGSYEFVDLVDAIDRKRQRVEAIESKKQRRVRRAS